ncbi:fasciclin domain-containing protein [Wenzhouxiangella sp. EGI_FJ10305]|uniref:fasciclin domain-containing protein n=1 Tax=Wenzhouxiangella sp. EGI_FJ10305 TaxID=3243768 RepID=UPI0035D86B2C
MKTVFATSIAVTLLFVSALANAQGRPDRAGPPPGVVPGDQTIAEIVTESASADPAEFSLLLAAIGYIAETNPDSALISGLFDKEQYTVFAPNDQAFLALVGAVAGLLDQDILNNEGPFAAIDDLLGAGTIEAVVSYHVTEGRRASNSVVPRRGERSIETLLEGASFSVDSSGNIDAVGSDATIVGPNTSASNGVIHEIDAVLLPIDLGL